MPYASLKMQPGIDVEQSPLLNEAGFSFSQNVRFFEGLPQKLGGWLHLTATPLTGICRGMHAWADLNANPYLACGTDQRLEIYYGGALYDITPIRQTTNPAVKFSTTMGSNVVTINDPNANGAAQGDWINLIIPVSVGGLILQGLYQISTSLDANDYQIIAASNATSSVTSGGAVPTFQVFFGLPNVNVSLPNHGLSASAIFAVQVQLVIGGFTLLGNYTVSHVLDPNTFQIQPGGHANANSGPTGENGGNAQIQYLIASGLSSAVVVQAGGYGQGPYGQGPYGVGYQGTVTLPLRQWFLDNFGQDLIGNYTGSPLYVWQPPIGSPVAVPLDAINFPGAQSPPEEVNVSFVSAPQQMVIALGVDDVVNNQFDPLLLRWCDSQDFTDWYPKSTNQAGSYRVPSGSRLVGGISSPNFNVIWTDIEMWLMTYLGGTGLSELVWGFNKIAVGVDLVAARGAGVYRNLVYWISSNGFFTFDGNSIQMIPCPVWDKLWRNLNRLQIDKTNCQVNSWFQEISWAFPSASGSGEVDARITYNIRENSWTYDDIVNSQPAQSARTAWVDDNVLGAPIGSDPSSLLQQHETSNDADGGALLSSVRTGWFSIQEGTLLGFMERLSADFIAQGGDQTVQITVFAQDYPIGPVRTYGPYLWTPAAGPPFQIVRARGRFFSIQISSSGLGSFWRLGNTRYTATQAGKRP
ncbi:MAG TPA: hypothetical protein VGG45_16160 [Terracidiphilus sp.]|jgi:hypothetical protein